MATQTPPEPDSLDRKILYELDLNSRIGVPALARRVHVSPARARYRLSRLIESGAIHSFLAIVDYRSLGLRIYTVQYKIRELGPAALSRLLRSLARQPNLIDVFTTEGSFDVKFSFLAGDIDEAADYLWLIRERLGQHIIQEALTLQLDSFLYSRAAIRGPDAPESTAKLLYRLNVHEERVRLEEADRRLLAALSIHSDWPMWRIAKEARLSGPAAYARMRRLEKQKVILGYSIMLNPYLPGFSQYRVFVKMHYLPASRREELARFLQQLPPVWRSTFTFGDFDLIYDVIAPNSAALRVVMERVYERFGRQIIKQEWVRIHDILKFSFYPSSAKPLLRDETHA